MSVHILNCDGVINMLYMVGFFKCKKLKCCTWCFFFLLVLDVLFINYIFKTR